MSVVDEFEDLPQHEPAWQARERITAYRKRLLAAGYLPLPVNGKKVLLDDWSNINATNEIINAWSNEHPDHLSTGVLTRDTPFVDIDVTDEEVAEEIEALFESAIENSAVRIGFPPKRDIPFRADTPFKKRSRNLSRRTARFIKLKFSAMVSKSLLTAFIPIPASRTDGTVASRAPNYCTKICRY
jgi:hypothetical protein